MTRARTAMGFGVAFAASLVLASSCKMPAVDPAACRAVEDALCEKAPACGISLASPPHPEGDVQACIQFYEVACDHGLVTSIAPSSGEVTACVDAINAADCAVDASIVRDPSGSTECAWLLPPGTVVTTEDASSEDAGDGGDAGDASEDGGDGGDAGDAASDATSDAVPG